jgi:septation ring formation regulator EzrA
LDLATKDEFASLSNKIVDVEGEIDSLDESIYQIISLQKKNQHKLKMVRESLEEWVTFLNCEVRETRSNHIKTLENDLRDLKKLFEMDNMKEEIDHD